MGGHSDRTTFKNVTVVSLIFNKIEKPIIKGHILEYFLATISDSNPTFLKQQKE